MTNSPSASVATGSIPAPLLVRHGLDSSDDVLKLGDPAQHAVRREHIAFGCLQDDLTPVRLQAVEEGSELRHGADMVCGARFNICGAFDYPKPTCSPTASMWISGTFAAFPSS
ncbi:hypothetical protein [Methylobacterium oxalidis]|uniref:hypothetical protein n=1 Tax=Methylobacterium oxalidis TaxID=944322 RepID=UPI003315F5B6